MFKKKFIYKYIYHYNDTGSTSLQIILFTIRINKINFHLQKNKHDNSSRLGLLKLVNKRCKMLNYLKRKNYNMYLNLTFDLKFKN